jgi:NADH dehydrogenase
VRLSGFPAWVLWLAVHLVALTGFRNRAAVLFNWAIGFLGRGRPQRAVTKQQVFARRRRATRGGSAGTTRGRPIRAAFFSQAWHALSLVRVTLSARNRRRESGRAPGP